VIVEMLVSGILHIRLLLISLGRCFNDHSVNGFTSSYAICFYHNYDFKFTPPFVEVYFIQHYAIKFIGDLRQVSGFP